MTADTDGSSNTKRITWNVGEPYVSLIDGYCESKKVTITALHKRAFDRYDYFETQLNAGVKFYKSDPTTNELIELQFLN